MRHSFRKWTSRSFLCHESSLLSFLLGITRCHLPLGTRCERLQERGQKREQPQASDAAKNLSTPNRLQRVRFQNVRSGFLGQKWWDPPSRLPANRLVIFEGSRCCSSLLIQEQSKAMLWDLLTELFTINCTAALTASVRSGSPLMGESAVQCFCSYYSSALTVWLKWQMKKIINLK